MFSSARSTSLLAPAFLALALAAPLPAAAGLFSSSPVPPAEVPGAGRAVQAQFADPGQQAVRIDNLETTIRQLTGRIDELTHRIDTLQTILQRAQEDNEFRFKQLEGGKPGKRSEAPASQPAPGSPPTAVAGAGMGAGANVAPGTLADSGAMPSASADMPSTNVELPEAGFSIDANAATINDGGAELLGSPPRSLGTLPADAAGGPLDLSAIARGETATPPAEGTPMAGVATVSNLPPPGGAEVMAAPVQPGQLPPPPTVLPQGGLAAPPVAAAGAEVASLSPNAAADPRTAYESAYGKVVSGDYAGAEAAFKKFIADYPKDALAGGAHYWLGETYYSRGQYRDAATSFLTAYKDYPKNAKAPESLFKLGLSLEGLGETSAACATYGELNKKFPKAQPVLLTRVSTQRTKLGCQ
jgi:tol-pal system protein YbgF